MKERENVAPVIFLRERKANKRPGGTQRERTACGAEHRILGQEEARNVVKIPLIPRRGVLSKSGAGQQFKRCVK